MDWEGVIDKNRETLKRVLATLLAMAGVDEKTLPRRIHRAVLALLRPAEAAARRLIVVAARREIRPLVMRGSQPAPKSSFVPQGVIATGIVSGGIPFWKLGINILPPPLPLKRKRLTAYVLPLADTLRGFPRRPRRRYSKIEPRIWFMDDRDPPRLPPPPSPTANDPLDATRIQRRLAGLAAVLDDLPRHVKRYVRWQAKRDRMHAQGKPHRTRTLKPGRPPGWRKPGSCRAHEVHEILADLQYFAWCALEKPHDTS